MTRYVNITEIIYEEIEPSNEAGESISAKESDLRCIAVNQKANTFRERFMHEVVVYVHGLVGEFGYEHWVIERSLQLRPHFEHALLYCSTGNTSP